MKMRSYAATGWKTYSSYLKTSMDSMLLLKFSFLLYCVNSCLNEIDWMGNILLCEVFARMSVKLPKVFSSHFTEEEENKLCDA